MDISATMSRISSKIEALPPLKKNMLLVIPPILIIALAVYFLIMPAFEEKGILTEEVGNQTKQISSLSKDSSRLPALQAENKRLGDKLMVLQMQLPEEWEVSGLLKQVSDLGVQSGLQVVTWRPGIKSVYPGNEVYEIPVNVEMRGAYHKFGQFFSNITAIYRIVNISNITMRTGDQKMFPRGMTGLNVSFTATTYSIIPEKEKEALRKKVPKK
ncbi:MAG TPA: type 4a pilus biogenesis protein PilO [Dissulfurispiraceae bacterium]|nr:type 4a pilus biogenesis protein PilO [Dissulfurispiraceae bacterium]